MKQSDFNQMLYFLDRIAYLNRLLEVCRDKNRPAYINCLDFARRKLDAIWVKS